MGKQNYFVGYLIDNGKQSSMAKSYVSAIKAVLTNHGIKINEDQFLINSLTKACRLINDRIRTRLPIQKDMLVILLNQIDKHFDNINQPYLKIMYKALFSMAYFGLFRIGELTTGEHTVRAKDVQLGSNKRKLLFILWTSKTHGMDVKPQMIKITSSSKRCKKYKCNTICNKDNKLSALPCPYELLRQYLQVRGSYTTDDKQFFVLSDHSPVTPQHARTCLKTILQQSSFRTDVYTVHGLRSGQACDLLKLGLSVETIKKIGWWKSNAVFRYLR